MSCDYAYEMQNPSDSSEDANKVTWKIIKQRQFAHGIVEMLESNPLVVEEVLASISGHKVATISAYNVQTLTVSIILK